MDICEVSDCEKEATSSVTWDIDLGNDNKVSYRQRLCIEHKVNIYNTNIYNEMARKALNRAVNVLLPEETTNKERQAI